MNEYLYEITKNLSDDEWYTITKRKKGTYKDCAEVEDELWNTQESLNVLD